MVPGEPPVSLLQLEFVELVLAQVEFSAALVELSASHLHLPADLLQILATHPLVSPDIQRWRSVGAAVVFCPPALGEIA